MPVKVSALITSEPLHIFFSKYKSNGENLVYKCHTVMQTVGL